MREAHCSTALPPLGDKLSQTQSVSHALSSCLPVLFGSLLERELGDHTPTLKSESENQDLAQTDTKQCICTYIHTFSACIRYFSTASCAHRQTHIKTCNK